MHKMLDRYFSDKINKFLSIGLKIYGSSDINEILKVVEYEDIIVRDIFRLIRMSAYAVLHRGQAETCPFVI